jgi:hypothetical protein
MDAGVTVAVVAAGGSAAAAGLSGIFASRSSHVQEELRSSLEARSRLNAATGALRLELFLETRSFARRLVHYDRETLEDHDLSTRPDEGGPAAYHAAGMIVYRLLRPLAVGELVEKQTFDADLIVDPIMVDLLRFSHAGIEMLSGESIGRAFEGGDELPGFDMRSCWDPEPERRRRWMRAQAGDGHEVQRIRASYLRRAAAALLAPAGPAGESRCVTHPEFIERWDSPRRHPEFHDALRPAKDLLHEFRPRDHPIFWLRLVGYAYACRWFYRQVCDDIGHERIAVRDKRRASRGTRVGYAPLELDVPKLLGRLAHAREGGRLRVDAAYIAQHADEYEGKFDKIVMASL